MNVSLIISKYIKSSIIGAASPQYKKGVRVIVNFNTAKDPEYYVGTVSSLRGGLVYVIFDDGDKGSYKPTSSKVGLVGITKKKIGRKSEIPAKDINKWLDIDIGKNSPKRKPKSNVVKKKSKADFLKNRFNNRYKNEDESNKLNSDEKVVKFLNEWWGNWEFINTNSIQAILKLFPKAKYEGVAYRGVFDKPYKDLAWKSWGKNIKNVIKWINSGEQPRLGAYYIISTKLKGIDLEKLVSLIKPKYKKKIDKDMLKELKNTQEVLGPTKNFKIVKDGYK